MDETDEIELYYSYKVQEGDTLESIIQQFTEKKLVHTQNYIIDKNLSVQQVWNDKANKSPGHICHTGFSKREGKNAEECRVYPGEWVALPYEGFLCTPPIGDPKEQKKLRGYAEPKKKDAKVPEALWVHRKQKVKIIPIMFLPGIMGTRLQKNKKIKGTKKDKEKKETIWDPDNRLFMARLAVMSSTAKRDLLGITNTPNAESITDPVDSKRYTAEQVYRNYAAVAADFYEAFLKTLETKLNNPEAPQSVQDLEIIYPVYVCPYDWRKDITDIAGKEVKDVYDTIKKEQETGEMIIITHSMGGLVARKFLKDNKEIAGKIKGVIHGVQPAAGAVQFYAYFKCGTQNVLDGNSLKDKVLKKILGRKKRDFAGLCCDIPGAIELAPTSNLGEHQWLSWDAELEQKYGIEVQKDKIFSCYEDKSGILGLTAPDFDNTVKKLITGNIKLSKTFHENLQTFRHERTHTLSSSQVQTVQSVRIERNNITLDFAIEFYRGAAEAESLTDEQKELLKRKKKKIEQLIAMRKHSKDKAEKKWKNICKKLWNFQDPRIEIIVTKDNEGDGTVPLKSQQALETASKKENEAKEPYTGIEHSEFYKNDTVINDVITLIKELSAE